jgi:hypothetical protein
MRYTRLRRQIESGTLIGTHRTPFTGAPEKIAEAGKKRKRCSSSIKNDDGEEDDMLPKDEKGSSEDERQGGERRNTVVKEERRGSWSQFESSEESDGDSEDEIPLAKLRKAKMASNPMIPGVPNEVPSFTLPGNGVLMMLPPYQQSAAHPTYEFGHCMTGNRNQQMMPGEYYSGGRSKLTQPA